MVGTTSLQWWNCARGTGSAVIAAGQRTTIGLRVPPRWEASSFMPWYGELPAHAHAAWYYPMSRCHPRCKRSACSRRSRAARSHRRPARPGHPHARRSPRHLHQPRLEWLLVIRDAVPCGERLRAGRQHGTGGYPPLCLRALQCPLPVDIPAVVELPAVLISPLLHDVVRAVQAARGPVHEKRLVGLHGLVLAQPADGVVGQVRAEVVALLSCPGRQDARRVAAGSRSSPQVTARSPSAACWHWLI